MKKLILFLSLCCLLSCTSTKDGGYQREPMASVREYEIIHLINERGEEEDFGGYLVATFHVESKDVFTDDNTCESSDMVFWIEYGALSTAMTKTHYTTLPKAYMQRIEKENGKWDVKIYTLGQTYVLLEYKDTGYWCYLSPSN